MKKIPTIFVRDMPSGVMTREPNPLCAWVFSGECRATRKVDGTCALWRGGNLWKRREIKDGQKRPEGFVLADTDEITSRVMGWVPVADVPEDRWFREALENSGALVEEQTYELCGPKVQGNPENFPRHVLLPHGESFAPEAGEPPRDYDGLRAWLEPLDVEGIVWWATDGTKRMAKVKKKDFGLKRKP